LVGVGAAGPAGVVGGAAQRDGLDVDDLHGGGPAGWGTKPQRYATAAAASTAAVGAAPPDGVESRHEHATPLQVPDAEARVELPAAVRQRPHPGRNLARSHDPVRGHG